MDYQQFQVDSENITIEWVYNISTCEVNHFMLEVFNLSRNTKLNTGNLEPVASYNSTVNKFTIPLNEASSVMYYVRASISGLACGTKIKTFYSLSSHKGSWVQWNLQIKDILGSALYIKRLSFLINNDIGKGLPWIREVVLLEAWSFIGDYTVVAISWKEYDSMTWL